jgi:pseudouridine synthase
VCSRAEAERWIAAGRVSVNGTVVLFPARRIEPRRDVVRVDGRRVSDITERLVIALFKPVGYITSTTDPGGRATVYDLVRGLDAWVFPVGRLDRDSAGFLLLTNDHRLGQRLTDPAHHVPKTYHVRVEGAVTDEAITALREGITLEDGPTRPARVRMVGSLRDGTTWLEFTITEGRNRQLRRMCAAVGLNVADLVRVRIGGLALPELEPGQWRPLTAAEIAQLEEDASA